MNIQTEVPRTDLSIFRVAKTEVICIEKGSTVAEAARMMREHHIGDLVVTEFDGGIKRPIGIITDRDIAIQTLGRDVTVTDLTVAEVMTRTVETARVDEDVFSMISTMKKCGVSRLPLVDERGHLSGIVTAKNLFQALCKGMCDLADLSEKQQDVERENRH